MPDIIDETNTQEKRDENYQHSCFLLSFIQPKSSFHHSLFFQLYVLRSRRQNSRTRTIGRSSCRAHYCADPFRGAGMHRNHSNVVQQEILLMMLF